MQIKTTQSTIADQYSKYADNQYLLEGQPICSFPFSIESVPSEVKYLCWTLIDYDATPLCGFPWIHWLVADYKLENQLIKANISQLDNNLTQGTNSFISPLSPVTNKLLTTRYVGPTPPDKDHNYTLVVYGISEPLNLETGFYLNQLYQALEHKVIAKASINLIGRV